MGEVELEVVAAKENNGSSEVVRWEKSLPRMVLRVLLVEDDDSTRQIIAALLRKCNYKVAAVSDGLMAWETLKGRPRSIDLILTEVELPSISGHALLTLVMGHDICKHIPVIMMSSRDSISLVLNCMLKGAAGFLIKPVRRNELRNLWQHVWRRDMLAAGHLPHNLPVEQEKVEATAENIAEGDDSSDYASSMQKDKDRSEKRSDTQSSCAMPCLEDEGTYMQTMQNPSCLKTLSVYFSNIGKQRKKGRTEIDNEPIMTDSQTNGLRSKFLEDDHILVKTKSQDDGIGLQCDKENANVVSEIHNSNKRQFDCSSGAIDLIGSFDNCLKSSNENGSVNEVAKKPLLCPLLELSLRRSPPSGSKSGNASERNTLNRSDASAFSWYNDSKTSQPPFPKPLYDGSGLKESESRHNEDQYFEGTVCTSVPDATLGDCQEKTIGQSTGQSGQSELTFWSNEQGLGSVQQMILENGHAAHVRAPVFYALSGVPPAWSPKPVKQREHSPICMSTSLQSSSRTHSSEQGYHQSGGTTYTTDQNGYEQKNKEHAHMKSGSSVDQSASGNLLDGSTNNDDKPNCPVECDQNVTIVSDNRHYVSDGSKGMDSHRSSQREAALQKFRLKRKDRCFEKKVRYQSRKRLAEQRPRVKGQFVRHAQNDTPVSDADGHRW